MNKSGTETPSQMLAWSQRKAGHLKADSQRKPIEKPPELPVTMSGTTGF